MHVYSKTLLEPGGILKMPRQWPHAMKTAVLNICLAQTRLFFFPVPAFHRFYRFLSLTVSVWLWSLTWVGVIGEKKLRSCKSNIMVTKQSSKLLEWKMRSSPHTEGGVLQAKTSVFKLNESSTLFFPTVCDYIHYLCTSLRQDVGSVHLFDPRHNS